MEAFRVETTLTPSSGLSLEHLPFKGGEQVEVIILPKASSSRDSKYSLRGLPVTYTDPFRPVAEKDWESAA
jgi:hypothetical protein